MKRVLLFVLVMLAFGARVRAEEPLYPATVVIFNSAIPESTELAKFYAQKRNIARDHLVGLDCPRDEEISREDYDRTIAEPLRKIFRERKWWTVRDGSNPPLVIGNTIKFVALIKGVPLKIRAAEKYPGDRVQEGPLGTRNDASVDSEIAVLGHVTNEISGLVGNPYFQSFRPAIEGIDPSLLLVCRLDAPSAVTVRRMITDAIETEKNGLLGRAYVDGAHNTSGGLAIGDTWLNEVVQDLQKAGVPTVFDDSPELFPAGYPMSDAALYFGWYAQGVTGPFADPEFKFLPGAVAVHIYSFSANTLREPGASWVAALLSRGAAVSLGNVYEPYLQLTTKLDTFNNRLLHGFTFAESAYMATPGLSWMSVMVGDPLYRPFAFALQLDTKRENAAVPNEWKTYREFAVQNAGKSPEEIRTLARQVGSRARSGAIIEDVGGREARAGNFAIAASCFQQARSLYTKRDDILRVVVQEADVWVKAGQSQRALDAVRGVLKFVSPGPSATLLRQIEAKLAPPSPAPPGTPAQR